MKQLRIVAIALLLTTGIRAQTQQKDTASYAFSLQQAVDFGLQHSSDVKNAMIDEQAAKYKVWEVAGIGMPQVEASLDVKDFVELPTSLIPGEFFGGQPGTFIPIKFGTQYQATAGLQVNQLLFDGTYIAALQGTSVYKELATKKTSMTRTEVSYNVTKAYYTVLVNEQQQHLLDANVDRLKKLADDTKAIYENGFAEKLDYDRLTVAYNNLLSQQESVRRALAIGYAALKLQMGMDQTASLTLTDKVENMSFTPPATNTAKFDYTNRIEYSTLLTQKRGADILMKKDRFGYLPSVFVYGSLQTQAQRSEFDFFAQKRWYPIGIIGGGVKLPIFDGLQKHWRIQQDKLQIEQLNNGQQTLENVIDFQVETARIQLSNASSTLETQRKNLELAQSVFETTQKKQQQGVGSNLELLNAETSLKEAQTNYYTALYAAVSAKVDYDKATGVLNK